MSVCDRELVDPYMLGVCSANVMQTCAVLGLWHNLTREKTSLCREIIKWCNCITWLSQSERGWVFICLYCQHHVPVNLSVNLCSVNEE